MHQNAILTSLDAVSSLVRGTPNSSTWFTSFPMCLTAQYAKKMIPLIPSNTIVCSLQCLVLHTVYCVHTYYCYHLPSAFTYLLCWGCCVVQNDKMMIEVEQLQRSHQADLMQPWLCHSCAKSGQWFPEKNHENPMEGDTNNAAICWDAKQLSQQRNNQSRGWGNVGHWE